VKIKLKHHRQTLNGVIMTAITFLVLSYWIKGMVLLAFTWINGYGFLLTRYDKRLSMHDKGYRIPEKSFWLIAFALGASGIFTAMIRYRHKTRHLLLKWGIATIMLIQWILLTVGFSIWWGVLK
jgi:uncharacterized membrane protein YsdA (DUF1294 family)